MTDPVEDRIRSAVDDGPGPSHELVSRVTRAAGESVERRPARARRGLSWRRPLVLAGAAVVLAAGGAFAAVMADRGSDGPLPLPPESAAAVRESAILARASWLVPSNDPPRLQTTRRLPSLRYPAGTTYERALRRLVESLAADGTLPDEATLAPPMPRGSIWGRTRAGSRLDLTAPFGYHVPSGQVLAPTFSFPGSMPGEEAAAEARQIQREGLRAAQAAIVDIPPLLACQRLARKKPCKLVPVTPAN